MDEKTIKDAIYALNDFPLSEAQQSLVNYLLYNVDEIVETFEEEVL